jgi:glycerol-3-phosphate acyltransferase PlsY
MTTREMFDFLWNNRTRRLQFIRDLVFESGAYSMKHLGRKFYHLAGGIGLLSLYYVLGREKALMFYAVFFLVVLGLDLLRLKLPAVNRFIFEKFGSFIRTSEEHKLTGTPPYVLGIGLSLYLYSGGIATAAICFLAFGDVAATAIGERYGRTKIGDKSLEGTLAFVAAAAAAGLLLPLVGVSVIPGVILTGTIVAAAVELLPLPVNDNLVIPLVSGGVMSLIVRLTGAA